MNKVKEIAYTFGQWPLAYLSMLAMWMVVDCKKK